MKNILNVVGAAVVLFSFSCAKQEELAAEIPPVIIEPKLVNATEDSELDFSTSGGLGFYQYEVVSGTASISSTTGELTDLQPGQIVVRVSDIMGNFDEAVVNVNSGFSLRDPVMYVTYGQQTTLQFQGGVAPVVFTSLSGDSLIDPNTGVFTASSSTSKSIIKVTDAIGNVQIAEVNVVPPLQFQEFNLTLSYGDTHLFQVQGGVPPYSFSILAGSGTLFQQQGVFIAPYFSNNPVVRVTDSVGLTRDIQIQVVQGP